MGLAMLAMAACSDTVEAPYALRAGSVPAAADGGECNPEALPAQLGGDVGPDEGAVLYYDQQLGFDFCEDWMLGSTRCEDEASAAGLEFDPPLEMFMSTDPELGTYCGCRCPGDVSPPTWEPAVIGSSEPQACAEQLDAAITSTGAELPLDPRGFIAMGTIGPSFDIAGSERCDRLERNLDLPTGTLFPVALPAEQEGQWEFGCQCFDPCAMTPSVAQLLESHDSRGQGTEPWPFELYRSAQLHSLAFAEATDLAAHYQQCVDIDVTNLGVSIPATGLSFSGTYDGRYNEVSGFAGWDGLFDELDGAHVHDLTLNAPVVSGSSWKGALASTAANGALIENIAVEGATVAGTGSGATGGIVGRLGSGSTIAWSDIVDSQVSTTAINAGGIAGLVVDDGTSVIGCTVAGIDVSAPLDYSNAGGLVGRAAVDTSVLGSRVTASHVSGVFAGGLVGANEATVVDCEADADVVGTSAGGAVGGQAELAVLSDVHASGTLGAGDADVGQYGGLVGALMGGTVEGCSSTTQIMLSATAEQGEFIAAGGLVGQLGSSQSVVLHDSFSTGTITVSSDDQVIRVGGVAGHIPPSVVPIEVRNVYGAGTIAVGGTTMDPQVGAFVGRAPLSFNEATLIDSFFVGTVIGPTPGPCIAGTGGEALTTAGLWIASETAVGCNPEPGLGVAPQDAFSQPNDTLGYAWPDALWNFVEGQLPLLWN